MTTGAQLFSSVEIKPDAPTEAADELLLPGLLLSKEAIAKPKPTLEPKTWPNTSKKTGPARLSSESPFALLFGRPEPMVQILTAELHSGDRTYDNTFYDGDLW